MRILMLGAGAVGGYFGGRMVAAGSDVTFLVRKGRATQLRNGLKIESLHGDATIPVKAITGAESPDTYDAVILSCKAYGLMGALDSISPYVCSGMPILPLLNGFAHLELIERRFPSAVVWGGSAGIAATMTDNGTIRQMHPNQIITTGIRADQSSSAAQLESLVSEMTRAEINATVSSDIEGAMWEKWTFLTTLAASTCLMRGSISQILATEYGEGFIAALFDECNRTAIAEGHPPASSPAVDYRGMLFDRESDFTASMLRDMDAGGLTEADHIVGDMIARAERHKIDTPNLKVAYSRLQVYESQRST